MDETHLSAHIGQYALIKNGDGNVLMLERARSKTWCLPGGRLNENEDWDTALLREINEEIGLVCQNPKPLTVNILADDYQTKYCVYFTLDCPDLTTLKLSGEHSDYGWFNADKAKSLDIEDEKVKQVVLKYLAKQ